LTASLAGAELFGACAANFFAYSIYIYLLRSSSFNSPKIAYELSRFNTYGSSMTKISPSLFFKVTLVIPLTGFIPTF